MENNLLAALDSPVLIKIKGTKFFLKCFPYKNNKWRLNLSDGSKNDKPIARSATTSQLVTLFSWLSANTNKSKRLTKLTKLTKKYYESSILRDPLRQSN